MEGLLKEQYTLRDLIVSHKHQTENELSKFLKSQEEIAKEQNINIGNMKENIKKLNTNIENNNSCENKLSSNITLIERQLKGT